MTAVERLRIETLARHRELIPVLASWHADPETDASRFSFWAEQLRDEAGPAGVPSVWVAFDAETAVGSVSLVARNMETHPELTPWLAGLYVVPGRRRRGIGTALVERCENEAWRTGAPYLYLYTSTARPFYSRLGWARIGEEIYEAERVSLMVRRAPRTIATVAR